MLWRTAAEVGEAASMSAAAASTAAASAAAWGASVGSAAEAKASELDIGAIEFDRGPGFGGGGWWGYCNYNPYDPTPNPYYAWCQE